MERLVSPVCNLVTLGALCAMAVAAGTKFRRLRTTRQMLQFAGALAVVAGTLVSAVVRADLVSGALYRALSPQRHAFLGRLWLLGSLIITMGFVCFAWGYAADETEASSQGRASEAAAGGRH